MKIEKQKLARKDKDKAQSLTAEQVCATVARSGLSRLEFAEQVGCGTSQLYKYQQEGLPPRMHKTGRAHMLKLAMETGVVPDNAATRDEIRKLAKG